MKRQATILACILAFSITCGAQTIGPAKAKYAQFCQTSSSSADKTQCYIQLYDCYKSCMSYVEGGNISDGHLQECKQILRNIWNPLQDAAIYWSQKGSSSNALTFARAHVNIPLMNIFNGEQFSKGSNWVTMVYFAASGTYNAKLYQDAVRYFKEYLRTGVSDKRTDVYKYMSQAYVFLNDKHNALETINDAVQEFPGSFDLLSMGINLCIDLNDKDKLQEYVVSARKINPNHETLLNLQGKLYEENGEFAKALDMWLRLQQQKPRSLDVAKHVALNRYNLGVMYYNRKIGVSNKSEADKYDNLAKKQFNDAIPVFNSILVTEPGSLQYLEGLATIYSITGRYSDAEEVNSKIRLAGGKVVKKNDIPVILAYDGKSSSYVNREAPETEQYANSASIDNSSSVQTFSAFAKEYVETRLRTWQAKDPYETVKEYKERVNEDSREAKSKELMTSAKEEYIRKYSRKLRPTDFSLKPYDAENEVFLADSEYGEIIIPVPRSNNQARLFESSWNGIQLRDAQFCVANDRIAISNLTFVTPAGKSYVFDGNKELSYTETVVDIDFEDIDYSALGHSSTERSRVNKQTVKVGSSDVDTDIPVVSSSNPNTFAMVIANENYEIVAPVPYASNDGKVFCEYCQKTLGIPKNNIRYYPDATYGTMLRAMKDIRDIASNYKENEMKLLVYYAGHGIPNESDKDAYLLPVDSDGLQTEVCYSLGKLYSELGGLKAASVTVFLDACFSGAQRDGKMLASARGVAIKAKQGEPAGNMVVLSAATGNETAFPYEEQNHGLFTYFLLKKLKETKGNVSLGELQEYVSENVRKQSVIINRKSQTPTAIPSSEMASKWKSMNLK